MILHNIQMQTHSWFTVILAFVPALPSAGQYTSWVCVGEAPESVKVIALTFVRGNQYLNDWEAKPGFTTSPLLKYWNQSILIGEQNLYLLLAMAITFLMLPG